MVNPSVDYTSRDFASLRQSLLDYASVAFPDWSPASEGDFGVLLLEMMAYTGDVLSYYVDRAQNEAYLPTATQRDSVLRIAEMLGYVVGTGSPASGTVTVQNASTASTFLPAGTKFVTDYVGSIDGPLVFESLADATVPAAVNGTSGQYVVNVIEGDTKVDPTTGNPLKIGTSDGTATQSFKLPYPHAYRDTIQAFVNTEEWVLVDRLLDGGPDDKIYAVSVDANGYTWIDFGDGLNGAIPPVGLDVTATYRAGYGAAGNIGAGKVVGFYATAPGGLSVALDATATPITSAMTGGADEEDTEHVRNNAPLSFKTQNRAVTLDDFASAALAVPGVAKANAVAGYFSSVTVYVTDASGATPSALLARTSTSLNQKALAGVSVTVAAPTFVGVNITGTIQVYPTAKQSVVLANVNAALKKVFALPSVQMGQVLPVSALYQAIMSVSGVMQASISLLARGDGTLTGVSDIQFLDWEIPSLGTLSITATGGVS